MGPSPRPRNAHVSTDLPHGLAAVVRARPVPSTSRTRWAKTPNGSLASSPAVAGWTASTRSWCVGEYTAPTSPTATLAETSHARSTLDPRTEGSGVSSSHVNVPRDAVTAVITFFDSERYLAEAADSVLAQTHPSVELVLVDDGSSDQSSDIARSYTPAADYVRRENGGPAAARNTGLAHASGEFIVFLDSDNRWLPRKTEVQLAAFADDPGVDVVFAQAREFVSPELDPSALPARGPRGSNDRCPGVLDARPPRSVRSVGLFDEGLRIGEWVDWYTRLQESDCPRVGAPRGGRRPSDPRDEQLGRSPRRSTRIRPGAQSRARPSSTQRPDAVALPISATVAGPRGSGGARSGSRRSP